MLCMLISHLLKVVYAITISNLLNTYCMILYNDNTCNLNNGIH